MAIARRDAVRSLVGLQSCGGSRFYSCMIAKLYNHGVHQGSFCAQLQISLNGIHGMKFQLPAICILSLCTTSFSSTAAAASDEMKRHCDSCEVNGKVRNARSAALHSARTIGCSQRSANDRVYCHRSINVPEHKQMLMQIEPSFPHNNGLMVAQGKGSNHGGEHMFDVFTAMDAEYKPFELPLATKTSVNCSSLTKKVDSWMCSIEETHQKAQVISQESADLKQRLESLLNEIVSTRTQLVDGVSPHARPNHAGAPCGEPAVCLECAVVDIKDGCCKNNNFFEITSSSMSEDESLRRRHSSSLMSCHAGITSSGDEQTTTMEEQMSDLSDADLMFEEDIEAVMQSILTDSLTETSPDFAPSFPFNVDSCIEEQEHPLGDDFSCLDTQWDTTPDAMRSAFEMNTSLHHPCDSVNSNYHFCDAVVPAERTAGVKSEALMSACHIHDSSNAHKEQRTSSLNEDSETSSHESPPELLSASSISLEAVQCHEVECLEPVQYSMQKSKSAATDHCGIFFEDSTSEESGQSSREETHEEETVLNFSLLEPWATSTEEGINEQEVLVWGHTSKSSVMSDHEQLALTSMTTPISSSADIPVGLGERNGIRSDKRSAQEANSYPFTDIFEEEHALDDDSLLKMVEERLINASLKSGFRFISSRSRYTFGSSSKSRKQQHYCKQPLTSIPEDSVEEMVMHFSEQCRKSSRYACRKRSLLSLFVPSFLWSSS